MSVAERTQIPETGTPETRSTGTGASSQRRVCVSVHDVAPATWPACERLVAMLDELGPLPLTFLVVPDYHRRGRVDRDPAFLRAMERRLASGDEIALHGYYHVDDAPPPRGPRDWFQRRMMTDREGEFAALSADEARRRLEWGSKLMRELGWPAAGFIAPAWLLSKGCREALAEFDFTYTTTRGGIFRLPEWRYSAAPAVAYSVRTTLRRRVSLALIAAQQRITRDAPLLRLSLHPIDACFDDVMAQWRRVIGQALQSHLPVTKAAWAAHSLR